MSKRFHYSLIKSETTMTEEDYTQTEESFSGSCMRQTSQRDWFQSKQNYKPGRATVLLTKMVASRDSRDNLLRQSILLIHLEAFPTPSVMHQVYLQPCSVFSGKPTAFSWKYTQPRALWHIVCLLFTQAFVSLQICSFRPKLTQEAESWNAKGRPT